MKPKTSVRKLVTFLKGLEIIPINAHNKKGFRKWLVEKKKFSDVSIDQIETKLLDLGYIQANIDGVRDMPVVTDSGRKYIYQQELPVVIRRNYLHYLGIIKRFFTVHVPEAYKRNKKQIIYGLIGFLIFYLLFPFVKEKLNVYWVRPIASQYKSKVIIDVLVLLASGFMLLKNLSRQLLVVDVFLLIVYFYLRVSGVWDFFGFFHSTNFLYIDLIGYYYAIMLFSSFWEYRKSLRSKPTYLDGYLFPDLPIAKMALKAGTNINDQDLLKRKRFAQLISDSIRLIVPYQSFAIGICGPWGSGKTSLISLIVDDLKNKQEETNTNYLFIDFSPWHFANSEMLVANFFSALEAKFKKNKSLAADLRAYSSQVTMVEKTIFKTEFSKFLDGAKDVSLKDRYDRISREIERQDDVLIITIDDLDRLDKKEIVDVFKLIRAIADFPKTFYIVGYDRGYITAAIKKELTEYNPEKYIDKIFNYEFKIPELSSSTISDRLKASINLQLLILKKKKVISVDSEEYELCFIESYCDSIIQNERDIKRFTNNLLMRYLTINGELNFFHFFLLELIYYKNPVIYTKIFNERETVLTVKKENQIAISNSVTINNNRYSSLFAGDSGDKSILRILYELFESDKTYRKALNDRTYFLRYFSLSLMENEYSAELFENAFSKPAEELGSDLIEFHFRNSTLLKSNLTNKFDENGAIEEGFFKKCAVALLMLFKYVSLEKNEVDNGLTKDDVRKLMGALVREVKDLEFISQSIFNEFPDENDGYIFLSLVEIQFFKRPNSYVNFSNEESCIELCIQIQSHLLDKFMAGNFRSDDPRIFVFLKAINSSTGEAKLLAKNNNENKKIEEINRRFKVEVLEKYQSYFRNNEQVVYDYFMNAISSRQLSLIGLQNEIRDMLGSFPPQIYRALGMVRIAELLGGYTFIDTKKCDFKSEEAIPYNDQHLPSPIDLHDVKRIVCELRLIKDKFWRFGIYLTQTVSSPTFDKSRHPDDALLIHISRSISENELQPMGNNDILLDFYNGKGNFPIENFVHEFHAHLFFILSFFRDKVIVELHSPSGPVAQSIVDVPENYHFGRISAWADNHQLEIESTISFFNKAELL
jgi:GTPase SAR1 family protein